MQHKLQNACALEKEFLETRKHLVRAENAIRDYEEDIGYYIVSNHIFNLI